MLFCWDSKKPRMTYRDFIQLLGCLCPNHHNTILDVVWIYFCSRMNETCGRQHLLLTWVGAKPKLFIWITEKPSAVVPLVAFCLFKERLPRRRHFNEFKCTFTLAFTPIAKHYLSLSKMLENGTNPVFHKLIWGKRPRKTSGKTWKDDTQLHLSLVQTASQNPIFFAHPDWNWMALL